MTVKTDAIVLSAVKYGDADLIVKCYTRLGLKSYLLKRILGASKKSKLRASYFQPLMQLELIAQHNNKGQLNYIKEARISRPNHGIYSDIVKQTLAIFISEILVNSLYEEESNEALYSYLEGSFNWLNNNNELANFHLVFLINLSKHLGFYPDQSNSEFQYFDLSEGVFCKTKPTYNYLEYPNLAFFKSLLGITFDDQKTLRLTGDVRHETLGILIQFFELHLPLFRKPKSLTILKTVFE